MFVENMKSLNLGEKTCNDQNEDSENPVLLSALNQNKH